MISQFVLYIRIRNIITNYIACRSKAVNRKIQGSLEFQRTSAAMEKREMSVTWCDSSIDAKSPSHSLAARISHGRKVAISDKWNGRLNLESFSVRFLTFGVVTPLTTGSSVGSLPGRTLQMTNTGRSHLETWNVACNVAKLELPTQTFANGAGRGAVAAYCCKEIFYNLYILFDAHRSLLSFIKRVRLNGTFRNHPSRTKSHGCKPITAAS